MASGETDPDARATISAAATRPGTERGPEVATPGTAPARPASTHLPADSRRAATAPPIATDRGEHLFGARMWTLVWLPIAAITVLHYASAPGALWTHNVLRRLYYLPIIVAAFQHGLRGGLLAAATSSAAYLPHAFLHMGAVANRDPASAPEKALEMVLYHLVGAVAGYLAGQLRRQQQQLERALGEQRRLQHQLVRAGRLGALGEVVAGVAHEIKNPLHALRGTAEIVDPLIDPGCEERRMWEIHLSELDRLARVAERFLSFASPGPVAFEPLDLRQVAERLVELVGADARKRSIALDLELPTQAVAIRGDRDLLAQVALNIALNGMQALGPVGGQIRVSVRPAATDTAAPMASLRIENDGPPIAEGELEHLFDPFHSGSEGGSGLGLSIASRIAEQHEGYIEATNEGLGVTFTLLLPAG